MSVIKVYTSTKDSSLYKYYFKEELKFGQNAGCQYGLGTYCTMDRPDVAGAKWKDRGTLYGNILYEFEIDDRRVFFLDYEDFAGSSVGLAHGPDEAGYLSFQWSKFNLKNPPRETFENLKSVNSAQRANAFYRLLRKLYPMRPDGSLDCPVNAFVYTGKLDGHTMVVWDPYSLVPSKFSEDGGNTWQDLDKDDPEYKKYIEKSTSINLNGRYNADTEKNNFNRIFDGNPTPEKKQVYELLQTYGESSHQFLGQFSNIVIHDDDTIDLKYNSGLPQHDDYTHCFRITKEDNLEKIFEMGYRIGRLDGWIKFGSESKPGDWGPDNWKSYMPRECTGGIALRGLTLEGHKLADILDTGIELGENILSFKKCKIESILGFDRFNKLQFDEKKPTYCSKDVKTTIQELYDESFAGLEVEGDKPIEEKPKKTSKSKKSIKESLVDSFLSKLKESINIKNIINELDWIPSRKKDYEIQGMIPSKTREFSNKLEGAHYEVGPEDDKVIMKGTVGELWATPISKVCKTYGVKEEDFILDEWIPLHAKGGGDWNTFAAKLPDEMIEVETSWGDLLKANRPEVEHGDGDWAVCNNKNGEPDFSDIWVVNGAVFPTTYEIQD